MKLYYEFKKIILSKDFWIITGIFLILNIGLILFEINTNNDIRVRHSNEYYKLTDTLEQFDYSTKINYLNDQIDDTTKLLEIEEKLNSGLSINDLDIQDKNLYLKYNNETKQMSLASFKQLLQTTLFEAKNTGWATLK